MRINGSTVLLTGVTGGIGTALAEELSRRGARLILTGRRRDAVEPLAKEYGARAVVADLADPQDVERLAAEASGTQILLANAALPSSGELLDYTPDQIDRALAVNLRAPAMLARLLAPAMVEARRGQLVFVGSISGKKRRSTPRSTTRPSSVCGASRSGCGRTCTNTRSACRSCSPVSSGTRACSRRPAPSLRRECARSRPARSSWGSFARSSATGRK